MVNGTQMTLDEFSQETFLMPTAGASDSLVRTSASQESSSDLQEIAQACFSELCTFLGSSQKKKDPSTYSLRMLRICLALMADGISPGFSLRWTRGGTIRNGKFSIPKNLEYHRTEKGYSLSDVLEDTVDEKYYLSQAQVDKILFA